jgi:hypothetical protein
MAITRFQKFRYRLMYNVGCYRDNVKNDVRDRFPDRPYNRTLSESSLKMMGDNVNYAKWVRKEFLTKFEDPVDIRNQDIRWFVSACKNGHIEVAQWRWNLLIHGEPMDPDGLNEAAEQALKYRRYDLAQWFYTCYQFDISMLSPEVQNHITQINVFVKSA